MLATTLNGSEAPGAGLNLSLALLRWKASEEQTSYHASEVRPTVQKVLVTWALKTTPTRILEFGCHGLWHLEVESSEVLMLQATKAWDQRPKNGSDEL